MDLSTVEFTSIITLEDLIFVLNCVFDTVCKVLKFGKYFAFWLLRGKPIENERIGKKKAIIFDGTEACDKGCPLIRTNHSIQVSK